MEDNKDQILDNFAKKQLKELSLDSPSKGFTNAIMNTITAKEAKKVITYQPLISKKVWLGIAALVVGIFFIPFQAQEDSILKKVSIDFSFLDHINTTGIFDGLAVSSNTFYAALLFSVMISIQIFYLKGYFSKRASGL
jgi:hypothetical protein